jgi:uncharacterized protein (TIGR00290 family)
MRTILSWSTGKDSAWALHVLRGTPGIEVVGLLSTINTAFDRVAMHGVRRTLLEAQAQAAGLPLHIVAIPHPCPNEVYEQRMAAFVAEARDAGVEAIAFGDLFLESIRAYREERMRGTGLTPLFPVWGHDTRQLAEEMISGGLEARIACLDPRVMPREFAGREFDAALLAELPAGIDPCGENGEFHTFAFGGPMFAGPIAVALGSVAEREGFLFQDILPAGA